MADVAARQTSAQLRASPGQRLDRSHTHGSTKALDQTLCHVIAAGVIDDVLGLHHLARYVVKIAQLVGQTHLDRLLTRPEQATEGVWRGFQPITPARLDHCNEL